MATGPEDTSPDSISAHQFAALLSAYPSLIASTSAKRVKAGQRTLQELDDFRYVEAPQQFGAVPQKRDMSLDDVKLLVEWKLRHGKFRPALMKHVSSNDPASSQAAITEAIALHRQQADAGESETGGKALGQLTASLRGVGPATASLLLAVHDPDRVIFFSDEAFYWLCCGGKKAPIKYSAKEYEALAAAARLVTVRLRVPALSVEKVAYVIMKQAEVAPAQVKKEEGAKSKPPRAKRKAAEEVVGRRSQRQRLRSNR